MQIVSVVFSILNIVALAVAILSHIVFWVMAFYGSITRKDLKNSRALLIVLLLFTGSIGTLVYFFSENQKKLGKLFLLLGLVVPVAVAVLNSVLIMVFRSA